MLSDRGDTLGLVILASRAYDDYLLVARNLSNSRFLEALAGVI